MRLQVTRMTRVQTQTVSEPKPLGKPLGKPRNGDSIHDAFKEVRSVGGILLQAWNLWNYATRNKKLRSRGSWPRY